MRIGERKVINNTKLIMNVFSYLELVDLVKMRSMNATCKIISDYYIKINMNRDKIKYKGVSKYNLGNKNEMEESSSPNHTGDSCSYNLKSINCSNENDRSIIRMKFLQLWNTYSNKSSIDKIDYNDSKLVDLIKVVIYLISNIKDNNDCNLIFNQFSFGSELYRILDSVKCEFELINANTASLNGNYESKDGSQKCNYIKEFFKNETLWKCIAILSGYNLSNAELVNNENGNVIDYYLWPEKTSEPVQCMITYNAIDLILFKLNNISNINKNIHKQIYSLINKSKSAELNFYNNSGVIVNKRNINISSNDNVFNSFELSNGFFDTSSRDYSNSLGENSSINDEVFCNLVIWTLNIIKMQKQLPLIKKKASNSNEEYDFPPFPSGCLNNRHALVKNSDFSNDDLFKNNDVIKQNSNAFSKCNCFRYKTGNSKSEAKLEDNLNALNISERKSWPCYNSNYSSCSYDECKQLPETVSKLCGVVKTQESLLSDLKLILRTMKRR
ncbi:hypothetical protein FG386_001741 [Cryptosporidium ryanae]|uniref:uncharacterized protein n=1 Tax=Cryptosporidium ryanae TaxID=515981 RepID=UPI00351A293A|nr:hypothetical protein FG386_001741 [Cryptosporidium ryanae]